MPYLQRDIKSYNRTIYGKQNDEVTVLHVNGEVAIVELNGNRFPVRAELLSEEPIDVPIPEPPALRAPKSNDKDQLNLFGL